MTFTAAIRNAGDFSGSNTQVAFSYTEDGDPNSYPIDRLACQSLASGSVAEIKTKQWVVPERWAARKLLIQVIDGREGIKDLNSDNDSTVHNLNNEDSPVLNVQFKDGSVTRKKKFLRKEKLQTRIVATVRNEGWKDLTGGVLQLGTSSDQDGENGLKDDDPLPVSVNEELHQQVDVHIPVLAPGESTDMILVPEVKMVAGTETIFYLRANRSVGAKADDQVRFWLKAPDTEPCPWTLVVAAGVAVVVLAGGGLIFAYGRKR